jgi:hypothetical protein
MEKMPVTTTNTRTLPQPQLVALFDKLFEKKPDDGWRSVRLGFSSLSQAVS